MYFAFDPQKEKYIFFENTKDLATYMLTKPLTDICDLKQSNPDFTHVTGCIKFRTNQNSLLESELYIRDTESNTFAKERYVELNRNRTNKEPSKIYENFNTIRKLHPESKVVIYHTEISPELTKLLTTKRIPRTYYYLLSERKRPYKSRPTKKHNKDKYIRLKYMIKRKKQICTYREQDIIDYIKESINKVYYPLRFYNDDHIKYAFIKNKIMQLNISHYSTTTNKQEINNIIDLCLIPIMNLEINLKKDYPVNDWKKIKKLTNTLMQKFNVKQEILNEEA